MIERGVPKPPEATQWLPDQKLTDTAWRWISRIWANYPKVQTFSVTINPASVSANTTSEQTFTVSGITTNDRMIVNKPTHTAGLIIGNARCSAADTLAITFGNLTGLAIDPPSESYRIVSIRL